MSPAPAQTHPYWYRPTQALVHLPHRMLIGGMSFPDALAATLALIPVSLLMGFVMLRAGSVVSSGLFHTFANWVGYVSR